ncbi:hypothetical protein EIP86_010099 [Pleurotus ostreatoroseus]|nr:hypothetical protein EIP86_010099 [Pleurotus ostreatoroseus]
MAELGLSHWTEEKVVEPTAHPQGASQDPVPTTDSVPQKEYVLRPLYQRLPFAGAQLFLGLSVAWAIVTTHARLVRRLYLLPHTALVQNRAYTAAVESLRQQRFVLVQTANPLAPGGHVFPLSWCKLRRPRDEGTMEFTVESLKVAFWLGLPGARIRGEELRSPYHMREALYQEWYGAREGKRMMAQTAWHGQLPGPTTGKA